MVERQIEARGVRHPAVLEAMRTVPREAFLAGELAEFAYEDAPLPIEAGQTISQPYIVALMAAALEPRPGDRLLEIGTGSGYAAAVLSRVAADVYTVERHEELARLAESRMRALGYTNVHVLHGDGTLGWAEHAPYDAIVVAAGGPDAPPALLEQLADGGRLVIPIGATPREQELVRDPAQRRHLPPREPRRRALRSAHRRRGLASPRVRRRRRSAPEPRRRGRRRHCCARQPSRSTVSTAPRSTR